MRSGLILLAPCLGRLGSGWLLLPAGVVRLDAENTALHFYVQLPFKHKELFCVDASRVLCRSLTLQNGVCADV